MNRLITTAPAALFSLALLTPLAAAEGTSPDASDMLFQTEGSMVASIKKLGKLKQQRSFGFYHGSFDFEIDNDEGAGITGYLDPDFNPPPLQADEPSAEDWFRERFAEWAVDQEQDISLDAIAMTMSKGRVKVRPAKLTLAISWSLVMSFDLALTVDGEELLTTAKLVLKGKGARAYQLGDTSWELTGKLRASVPKLGSYADQDDFDLSFNPDHTLEIDDPIAGQLDATWVADEMGRVTVELNTDEIQFVLEDIASEVQFETFKFLDDGVLEFSSAVIKVKVKAGVSITYSMTLKFAVSGTTEVNDTTKPVNGMARYTLRGRGCLGY
ncbi:MAG: hypothetical protein DRQ55_06430 [Planctomycetota bacterium]|nr:MAG: hypothetical protein DRQ55_06430 [Planctomycetota bacterium]